MWAISAIDLVEVLRENKWTCAAWANYGLMAFVVVRNNRLVLIHFHALRWFGMAGL